MTKSGDVFPLRHPHLIRTFSISRAQRANHAEFVLCRGEKTTVAKKPTCKMYLRIALYYLLVVNLLTFISYGIDKWKARHNRWRIPEATLLLLAALGGSIGALLAMKVFRHKTQHKKFRYGVPAILIVQMAVACVIVLS